MTKLTSDELREAISRAVPGGLEFSENDKPDGNMYASVVSDCDEFRISVSIVDFIAARYGVPDESVRLFWNPFEWRYSAEFDE